jgi:hypothetical protein
VAFSRTLHSSDVAATIGAAHALPTDPIGRGNMARRVPSTVERLSEVKRLDLWRGTAIPLDSCSRRRVLSTPA